MNHVGVGAGKNIKNVMENESMAKFSMTHIWLLKLLKKLC